VGYQTAGKPFSPRGRRNLLRRFEEGKNCMTVDPITKSGEKTNLQSTASVAREEEGSKKRPQPNGRKRSDNGEQRTQSAALPQLGGPCLGKGLGVRAIEEMGTDASYSEKRGQEFLEASRVNPSWTQEGTMEPKKKTQGKKKTKN